MITLDEKIVGVWYFHTDAWNGDYMTAIRELKPDSEYEIVYRFRYYNPENTGPFESGDRKSWYEGLIRNVSRHYVIETYRSMVKEFHKGAHGDELFEFLNDGDFSDFIKRFREAPFVFQRMATPEELKKELDNR